ncbi:hypothetical protein HU200_011094 [Digitaria exilis]|uniref:AP2/ERF domain-containing protein n=1 Tax=Digitaria exilis TaxID=1010633 RepID=A0A835FGW4_9POAL|nr:hypothetical protein HU200_011094 [Digitaria exilis]
MASAPSSGSGMLRKGRARRVTTGGKVHKDLGWVGVRERLWGGYAAEIRIPSSRSRVWIGRFQHARQAALAYDAAMFCFYGERLPNLRKYNFPTMPHPDIPEDVRRGLTIANVKAISEKHARSFACFVQVPQPLIPASISAAPRQVMEDGVGATAAIGVAVDGTDTGAKETADERAADEIYIDAEILNASDCQFSCNNPNDDFTGFMDMDFDLIFSDS